MRFLLIFALTLATVASAKADRILIVGDSLSCGHFGNNLIADLASQGHEVKMYCAVGSAPKNWIGGAPARAAWPCEVHTYSPAKVKVRKPSPHAEAIQSSACEGGFPKFSKILADNTSDRVIVALGTNSLPDGPDAHYDEMIDAIKVRNRSCDWILPPHLEPTRAKSPAGRKDLARKDAALTSLYAVMAAKLKGRCGSVSSLAATAAGTPGHATGEGLHQTEAAGRYRFLHMKSDIDRMLAEGRRAAPTDTVSTARSRR
jgi:hypothetical protein